MIKKNQYYLLFIMTAVIAVGILVEVVFRRPYSFHGTVINPPLPVTDFTLQTANNEVFRLSDQKGKIVLLFLGTPVVPMFVPLHWGRSSKCMRDWAMMLKRSGL